MSIYAPQNIYYVYAYLRSKDSTTASKGSPYYIGKGSNGRAYAQHGSINLPRDKSNIAFLETNLSENKAFEIEKFLIAYYGRKDLGTGILLNKTDGGEGSSGAICSPETRKKMSIANKGKSRSDETKQKMSIANSGENNPMYGKSLSDEHRNKISVARSGENNPMYGKSLSDEHRNKISVAKKGKTLSDKTKQKMSLANKGKTLSYETRKKLSIVNKGKTYSPETKRKLSIAKLNLPIVECPHCSKQGKGGAMLRWHFENCKHKLQDIPIGKFNCSPGF